MALSALSVVEPIPKGLVTGKRDIVTSLNLNESLGATTICHFD